ncbi:MAG: hypothetical protein NPINA01_18400 [Nitrospinaceae bacterium]|nr:MAG: hypothetical protein NPINA01_18400 [Nitrospinaceae bacterium]
MKVHEIEERALKFLKDRFPWAPETTQVVVNYEGKDVVLPPGNLEVNFYLPGRTVRLGRFPVQAKITVNKALQKRLRLTARVTQSIPLVTTRHPVNRGEILTAEDLRIEVSQSNRSFKHAVTRLEDAVGFELVRNLGAGRVITVNSLRKPPLVEKGNQVTLVAEKGSMRITAPGVVKEKGFKDSLIKVLNLQTKKMVFGQVVDSQTVKVKF